MDAVRQMNRVIPTSERHNYTVKSILKGSIISFGAETFRVESLAVYQEGNEKFTKRKDYKATEFKLFSLDTGEISYVEWEEDDGEVKMYRTIGEISFHQIKDDEGVGVDEDDLDQIVDDEDVIFVGGKKFRYDDDWAAFYSLDGNPDEEKLYLYEFKTADGIYLTVEEWNSGSGEEEYQLWFSKEIDPMAVEIISLGG